MESSVPTEEVIEALTKRGWCFGKIEEVKAVIIINSALHDEGCTIDFVESELANMDLRSFGAQSLPDQSLLRKSSYLHGPKVLQANSLYLIFLFYFFCFCAILVAERTAQRGNGKDWKL